MTRLISRRTTASLIAGTLAAPVFFIRNSWAEGKTITVGIYAGPQGEFVRKNVIPKFQSDLGCRVLATEGVTLGQIAILRTQKANPTYSVMFMDDVGVPIARDEGLITPLPKEKMPNLGKVLPRYLLGDGYAAAFAVSIVSPFFNTQSVTGIDSWAQLWDAKYKARFMLITPKQTQSVQLLVAATSLVTGKPFMQAQYDLDKGWDKMAALKPNVQTIYDNNVTGVLQVAQGQADIGGPDFSKNVLPYAMKKAPVAMSAPKEGVFGGVNTLTLVKGGPEPDLGAAFADRMLDPVVQKGLAEATLAAPTVAGITLNDETAKVVAYPEARIDALKVAIMDWGFINPRRGAIVEKYNQVFGA